MPERPAIRRSPLAHREPLAGENGAARIAEAPFLGKFILRADPPEAVERLRSALGLGLPFEPLTSSTAGGTSFLWMGPDEWMLVTPADAAAERLETARRALHGIHHQLVEVSDYYTAIEVSGERARELLMKLTTLDLHPRAFRAGMVTGSVFGRANATIWQTAGDADPGRPVFHLFIRWSMADYLWCLLAEAGREWGVPEQAPKKGETLTID
ncbi:MAG TPA: sarcosine oxidase subunit gamma family protein [Propylenella sp.]